MGEGGMIIAIKTIINKKLKNYGYNQYRQILGACI